MHRDIEEIVAFFRHTADQLEENSTTHISAGYAAEQIERTAPLLRRWREGTVSKDHFLRSIRILADLLYDFGKSVED